MKGTNFIRIFILSIVIISLAGPSLAQETLVVGCATAQTGYLAPYDGPTMEGFKLAVDELNSKGGINSKIKIELIEKDVRSDSAQTAIATQELVDEGVNVLITPCDADPSFAAATVAEKAKIPAFSFCASSPTLPLMGGDYMFSNFPGDNVQATVSAEWAIKQGYKTACILYSPDTQYTQLPLYFADVFEKLGGKVVLRVTHKMEQPDFSAEITKIKSLGKEPDVIMTSSYEPDFPAFIKQLRAMGVKSKVIGADAIDTPTTFALGSVVEGVVFTTPGFPLPGSPLEEFNKKYKQKYGKKSETVFNAIGYDLMKVIEAAVIQAGSIDPQKLRNAIAGLDNVQGATSSITYKGTSGMPIRKVSLVLVKDGKRKLIGQPEPRADLIPEPKL